MSFCGQKVKSPESEPWSRRLGRQFGAVEEIVLRLKELLFPSIADLAVLSADVSIAIAGRRGMYCARCHLSGVRGLVRPGSWFVPAISR
ncbi:hypothetical protein AMK20_17970 [Streptomyces sp. TSRI0261]|nr:hypothetical protein AMK20_17970 [Streptomyces sp. TSRI0261]